MTDANNVIRFPKRHGDTLPTTFAEIMPEMIKARETYADLLSADISGDVFAKCILAGFDNISDIRHAKDCILVVESIKSLLLKSINIEYTLQEFADRVMVIEDFDLDDDEFLD